LEKKNFDGQGRSRGTRWEQVANAAADTFRLQLTASFSNTQSRKYVFSGVVDLNMLTPITSHSSSVS
jgi:hypothetical protein